MKTWLASILLVLCGAAAAAQADLEAQSRALERAANAVVVVQTLAVPDARSNATLGRIRQGSGVVIEPDGLVLTMGYLILEADRVQLMLDDGKSLPAQVVGYDLATGFGLLQPLAPLKLAPAPLGRAAAVTPEEPLLIASGEPSDQLSAARLVSRRVFAGYWEYRIEGALLTTPPRTDLSGAGPIDLLRPILAELRSAGASAASRRAWLGINGVEHAGQVRVMRASDDSPAEEAGLRVGDRITAIDGVTVNTLDALWTQMWRGAPGREVAIEIERGEHKQTLHACTVDRNRQLKRASGV
jgi:S1-C subfamily serine protease